MGTISAYETAGGKRYRVRYRKPDHSQTDKRGFKTKRSAELLFASTEVREATGEFIDAQAAKVTISTFGTEWLRAYGILAAMIDVAVRDRRLPSNPARGVNLPRKVGKQRHYLTHAQVQILADDSRHNATLVLLLAYTGLRWGEAVGLRVNSLDLARRRVLVQTNAVRVGGHIVIGSPKGCEMRSVPFPAFLEALLTEQITGKQRNQLVFGDGNIYLATPTHGDGWFAGARKRARLTDSSIPV